jgi:hypothetical protein
LKPYTFAAVQNIKEADRAARERFCSCFCEAVYNVVFGLFLIYFTDVAWFYLNGHINVEDPGYNGIGL